MRIAYVCYNSEGKYPVIEEENDLLLHYLQDKGLDIHREVWNDAAVDWAAYDVAVLKASWDYFDRFGQFKEWLTKLEAIQLRVLNPVSTVRWNSDKHYLQDVEQAGLPIIPSIFIEKGKQPQLESYFSELNSDTLIIKPAVSGGAKNTLLLTRESLETVSPGILQLLRDEAFLVQPFIREIVEEGEWSLLFFGGNYSHCILKKPASGDFRVQNIHGGSVHSIEPPESLKALAQRYVDTFAQGCLYARVDGVMMGGAFALMELELIEPYLYLYGHPESYENYYQALKGML